PNNPGPTGLSSEASCSKTVVGVISFDPPGGCQKNLQPASRSASKNSILRGWSPAFNSTWPDTSSMACFLPLSIIYLPSRNTRDPSSDSSENVYLPSLSIRN